MNYLEKGKIGKEWSINDKSKYENNDISLKKELWLIIDLEQKWE